MAFCRKPCRNPQKKFLDESSEQTSGAIFRSLERTPPEEIPSRSSFSISRKLPLEESPEGSHEGVSKWISCEILGTPKRDSWKNFQREFLAKTVKEIASGIHSGNSWRNRQTGFPEGIPGVLFCLLLKSPERIRRGTHRKNSWKNPQRELLQKSLEGAPGEISRKTPKRNTWWILKRNFWENLQQKCLENSWKISQIELSKKPSQGTPRGIPKKNSQNICSRYLYNELLDKSAVGIPKRSSRRNSQEICRENLWGNPHRELLEKSTEGTL